ncbi:MAG: rhodanese-like domain-containing protein [Bacteroidetes bacterium]|nr:rhodanese-like domain-containing protein [Bacteroidota bacterium]
MKSEQSEITSECIKQELVKQYLVNKHKEVTIIDVCDENAFLQNHIPMAVNIPLDNLALKAPNFNKKVYLYLPATKEKSFQKKPLNYTEI